MTSKNRESQTQPFLIIYTGGTIGMHNSANGYQATGGINRLINASFGQQALEQLKPYDVLEFDELIDSSNAQPHHWLAIAKCIADNYQDYFGFIVLHGTDTMAYSAAAVHHMLGEHIKPVIFTGSQIPLSEARSDGVSNLQEAALFLRSTRVSQVCISFAGKLIAATAAKKLHTSAMQAFGSINKPLLAQADINLTFNESINQPANRCTEQKEYDTTSFKLAPLEQHSVSVLLLYPGINKASIDAALLSDNLKACVLLSYGAGNLADQNKDLISALTLARKKGITIINMTQCSQGSVAQGAYAAGSILNKLGVISAENRTLEDMVTDLYVNLAQVKSS